MTRARYPLLALVMIIVVPALLLTGIWRVAAGRSADDSAPNGPTGTAAVPTAPPSGATSLATPLMSLRRAPAALARDASGGALGSALDPLIATLNDTSCLAVAVDGKVVASDNSTLSLRPASNLKVVTAAVALDVLGPEYRFTTTVTGTPNGAGVVEGDLFFVGGGDPVLASSWWKGPSAAFPQFGSTSIEQLADAVVAAGVRRVTGSVVGDASRYDAEYYAPAWPQSVRFVEGGPISALLVNDSREAVDRSSNDPVVGAATVLTGLLRDRGVQIDGNPASGAAPASTEIARIQSEPLPTILAEMLTTSDNNTAELLLKEIGHQAGGAGTREAGLQVERDRLAGWGISLDGVQLADGSGLADTDRLTCDTLLGVLTHGSAGDPVGQGLPVAGQQGGTLVNFFGDTPAAGKLHGKTGTLGADGIPGQVGVKTLSGYLPVEGGGEIEFVLLLNGDGVADQRYQRPRWEQLVAAMVTYPAGPSVAALAPKQA